VTETASEGSARRDELLERSYGYVLEHGLSGVSLRPLAAAVGSSPRVLLFLFGSKDGLIRELLARARAEEVALLARSPDSTGADLARAGAETWRWLCAPEHRGLLRLWVDSYARSLVDSHGPWASFAQETVRDWLALLARAQPPGERDSPAGTARRTLVLAILRGAMLDLLATGDVRRTTRAVELALAQVATETTDGSA
jgi:AcrR family transcriptional regulator